MNRVARSLAATLFCSFAACDASHAELHTFRGLDPIPFGDRHPVSDQARSRFFEELAGHAVGIENFDSHFPGNDPRNLTFPSAGITATMKAVASGGNRVSDEGDPGMVGKYLISTPFGHHGFFEIAFNAPVVAFGFYGVNIDDFRSTPPVLAKTQFSVDGGSPIPVTDRPPGLIFDGSVYFFGVVSDTPFSRVRLISPLDAGYESIGLDSFTIAAVPEPETYALMLAGIAIVACAARGRAGSTAKT